MRWSNANIATILPTIRWSFNSSNLLWPGHMRLLLICLTISRGIADAKVAFPWFIEKTFWPSKIWAIYFNIFQSHAASLWICNNVFGLIEMDQPHTFSPISVDVDVGPVWIPTDIPQWFHEIFTDLGLTKLEAKDFSFFKGGAKQASLAWLTLDSKDHARKRTSNAEFCIPFSSNQTLPTMIVSMGLMWIWHGLLLKDSFLIVGFVSSKTHSGGCCRNRTLWVPCLWNTKNWFWYFKYCPEKTHITKPSIKTIGPYWLGQGWRVASGSLGSLWFSIVILALLNLPVPKHFGNHRSDCGRMLKNWK